MNGKDTKTYNRNRLIEFYSLCAAFLGGIVLLTGCASISDGQLIEKFNRTGESMTVPFSEQIISNAIVRWSQTLTNGYVLYDNFNTRLYHTSLTNDPANLFMLRNGTYAIGFWGNSACLPTGNTSYWADIIIRVIAIPEGSQISVAIHGNQFVHGIAWNFHTYGFEHEKTAELSPCPQDERQVLNEVATVLGQLNPQKSKN
jgi:hypothetical protein